MKTLNRISFSLIFFALCILVYVDFGQVERVFSANHPDPLEVDKAKKLLKVVEYHISHPVYLPLPTDYFLS